MSKASIVIDGAGVTVKYATVTLADINTVTFSLFGERDEINLTTIDATKFKQKLLGDLQKLPDVVINKKSDPQNDIRHYKTSLETLQIGYNVGKATGKVLALEGAQLKSISPSTLERAPGDGVNVDLTFFIGNMSGAAMTEDGPTVTT